MEAQDRVDFWRRSIRGWDIGFGVIAGIVALTFATTAPWPGPALVSLGSVAAIAVGYVTLGRPGAQSGTRTLTTAYLVVLVVATTAATLAVPSGAYLLFVSYSHIWFFTRSRTEGVLWTALLTAGMALATYATLEQRGGDPVDAAVQLAAGLVFSVGLGLWVTSVAERSEERAQLLDRLRAAQDELARSHHDAGVLAERARLAQEIHDTLAQGFTSVVMLSQAASAELERGRAAEAAARLGTIEQVARDNLAEARALVAAFAPPPLADADVRQALDRLAQGFARETGLAIDVRLDEGLALPAETSVVVLRAAQEALANVRRHAHASRVVLALTRRDGAVELAVDDDGTGIPDGTPEGFGLRGMRERADTAGGTLLVAAAAP
ncbi:sensor histidine kinase, partial [Cellulomonas massiliensis]|uniref:sensor histidine kinase n=1 Tax=Cellulomonas massiliensis TaxID=1465811 RepID=UPI000381BB40